MLAVSMRFIPVFIASLMISMAFLLPILCMVLQPSPIGDAYRFVVPSLLFSNFSHPNF